MTRALDPEGTVKRLLAGPAEGGAQASTRELLPDVMRSLDLGRDAAHLAWELARTAEDVTPLERAALVHLILAVLAAVRQGSTRLAVSAAPTQSTQPHSALDRLLAALGAGENEQAALTGLIARARRAGPADRPGRPILGVPGEQACFLLAGDRIYPHRLLVHEDRLVASLARRRQWASAEPADANRAAAVARALADVLARPPVLAGLPLRLSDDQSAAVERSARSSFTVVTGSPGTGKTSIVVALLRVLARLGVAPETFALAAPTGRAAARLEEAVRTGLRAVGEPSAEDRALDGHVPAPMTLHRLLGYSPRSGAFAHHAENPLSARVVVVDESSMVDLVLMDRLLRALPETTTLVLLGDSDQLPSVESGDVFRDLAARGAVRLTRSFRADPSAAPGRSIIEAAAAVREGVAEPLIGARGAAITRERARDVAFSGVEWLPRGNDPDTRSELLGRWYGERIRSLAELPRLSDKVYVRSSDGFAAEDESDLRALISHLESLRVLCVTRSAARPTGAEAVNQALHRMAMSDARARGAGDLRGSPAFCPGEPILVRQNDYERGLWNGDLGVVIRLRAAGGGGNHLAVVFGRSDRLAAHPLEVLRGSIELAFAVTVHKGQGSEYDHVVMMLPDEDIPLLSREVIYTAVTRSRRSVVLLGARPVIEAGLARRVRRDTGVAEKLEAS